MSHFAGIGHFSEHPCSGDDTSSCSSRADYCHSDSAYCHPEADSAPSGYSISSWAPDAYPLRAHRTIIGPSFRKTGFALWGADYRRCRDIHLSHHHLPSIWSFPYFSLCICICNPMLLIFYILGLVVLLVFLYSVLSWSNTNLSFLRTQIGRASCRERV